MTFEADAQSIEDSDVREGIEIILPVVTYRIATGRRDRLINGATFRASPAGRSAISIPSSGQDGAAIIELPCDHPLAVRYNAGTPPRKITVKIWQHQIRSGTDELIWQGEITSAEYSGDVARFRVPSRFSEALDVRIPTISSGRACGHVLYDANCRVDRDSYKITTTVVARLGTQMIVAALAQPNQWARYGELVHVPSGETMTIFDQVGTTITIQLPIHDLSPGDEVEIFAGCDHAITTGCQQKFDNEENFGGFPKLPFFNIHLPSGTGILDLIE